MKVMVFENKIEFSAIFLILVLFVLVSVSQVNGVNVDNASQYNTSKGSVNNQIQSILDNSKSSDTINFLGGRYENLSLVINKKLTIVGHNTTIVNYGNLDYIFKINPSANGTIITGFTFINNNGNGIYVNGASNIQIKNNKITSRNNGIYLYKTKDVAISNNVIQESTTGIRLIDSYDTDISGNTITKISGSGIYNDNSIGSNVHNNIISQNENGIYTTGSAKNLKITDNTISKNSANGIALDSSNNNGLHITSNNVFSNDVGVNFLKNYVDDSKKVIEYNRISTNTYMNLLVRESSYNQISIGANWYGANEREYAGVCQKAKTTLIQYDLIPYTVNGVAVPGIFLGVFHVGDKIITGLPQIDSIGALIYQGAEPGYNDEKFYSTAVNGVAIFNLSSVFKNVDQYKIKSWADNQYDILKKNIKIDLAGIALNGITSGNGGTGGSGNGGSGNIGNNNGGNGNNQGGGSGNNNGGSKSNNDGGDSYNGNSNLQNQDSSLGTNSNPDSGGENSVDSAKSVTGKEVDILDENQYYLDSANPYIIILTSIIITASICIGFLYKFRRHRI